jgi:cytosine/adenosine deaminase-related metal-dependent hydrolase
VIESGAVVIEGGRIVSVGVPSRIGRLADVDYGDAVICPGLVNAHTHLELSHLAGRCVPTADFIGWLRELHRLAVLYPSPRDSLEASVRSGVELSLRAGVTTVGDITRHPLFVRPLLASLPIRATSFGEVTAIGLTRSRLPDRLNEAASGEHECDLLTIGISPHAPYTVEPDGLRECALRACNSGREVPVCIHAAETEDETEYTLHRSGRLAEFLKDVGVWDESITVAGCRPIELLHRVELLSPRTVIAHANYVNDADIALIAGSGASVAYCPRTHAAFGHAPHRFRDMIRAGISVAIGTDSLASNPSLSVIDELRFLHNRIPDISGSDLWAMGTMMGAKALGMMEQVGTLRVGKRADLSVWPIEGAPRDVLGALLDADVSPIATYVDGGAVHAPGSNA